jgi:hypothetical protein
MQGVIYLKYITLCLTLLPAILTGIRCYQAWKRRRGLIAAGRATVVTRISMRRTIRIEALLCIICTALACLSFVSTQMPIEPVWRAIGTAQRHYWIAALTVRAIIAVGILVHEIEDQLDRNAIDAEQARLERVAKLAVS